MAHKRNCFLGKSKDICNILHDTRRGDNGWVVSFFADEEYTLGDSLYNTFKVRCSDDKSETALWYMQYRQRGTKDVPCVLILYPLECEMITIDLVREYD